MLTIGMVPALFEESDKNALIDGVRDEAKRAKINESPQDLWNFYVEKVNFLI